jgi:hypothetical protein
VPLPGQHGSGGCGVVGTGGRADPAGSGRTRDAVLEVDGQLAGVVLDVPAVAQQRVREAGLREQLLGGAVLCARLQRGGLGVDDARAGDEPHPGGLRGGDRTAVLADPLPDLAARDRQALPGAGERLP